MPAATVKRSLNRAVELYESPIWRWDPLIRLRLLTQNMSENLRIKIKTDTGKNPEQGALWNYEDLENAIKKHAIKSQDPMKLAMTFTEAIKGNTIDETNTKIENWLEEMEHATQGIQDNTIDEEKRKTAEDRYKNVAFREDLKHLLLRHSLPPKIAQKVRTFEISSNGSLELPKGDLIEYVRRLENNKENIIEDVNAVEWDSSKYNKKWTSEKRERRPELINIRREEFEKKR